MKNSFKLGILAVVIAISAAACGGSSKTTTADTTVKVDSTVKKDTVVKVDSTKKTLLKKIQPRKNKLNFFSVDFLVFYYWKVTSNFIFELQVTFSFSQLQLR